MRYVRGQRYLLELIVLGLSVNFCANAVFALWAPYADLVLHGGSATYGFLGAAIALGAIFGAAVIGKVDTHHSAGRFLFAGGSGIGASIILLGLTRSVPFALGEALLLGLLLSITNVPLLVLVQAKVPPQLMGRVMSVLMSLILASAPLGAYFAGTFAQATSIGFVYIVAGAIILATTSVGFLVMHDVRTVSY
jgi:predicted MFS family arabinose efflux permease